MTIAPKASWGCLYNVAFTLNCFGNFECVSFCSFAFKRHTSSCNGIFLLQWKQRVCPPPLRSVARRHPPAPSPVLLIPQPGEVWIQSAAMLSWDTATQQTLSRRCCSDVHLRPFREEEQIPSAVSKVTLVWVVKLRRNGHFPFGGLSLSTRSLVSAPLVRVVLCSCCLGLWAKLRLSSSRCCAYLGFRRRLRSILDFPAMFQRWAA